MGLTPANSIGLALAAGLAAAAAGGFYFYSASETSQAQSDRSASSPRQVSIDGAPPEERNAPVVAPDAPRFDVVRVAPDGSGLAAGRAPPGTRVRIQSGERTLVEVDAGPGGDFAAIFRADPDDEPRMLALEGEDAEGAIVRSGQQVLLLPPSPDPVPGERAAAPEAGGEWLEAAGQPANGQTLNDQRRDAAEDDAVAAAVILEPDEPAEITHPLEPALPAKQVSLASIDYGEDGSVRLAGSAPAGARLRVYVDGAHSSDRVADGGGRWQASLEGLQEGIYRIRVDELGESGAVASRVETPFKRTFPQTGGDAGSVTVQPGNNLWTIARTRYGSGMLYTQIFTANADLIEDPDLIYPGQIFALPALKRERGGPKARP